MLSNFRCVAATTSRQSWQRALAMHKGSVAHTRMLATGPDAQDTTVLRPVWFKPPSAHGRQNLFNYLTKIAQQALNKAEKSPEDVWREREKHDVPNLPRPNDAYSGRSVPIVYKDVSMALTKLRGILTVNAVRQTSVRDERHEKKGEKRNRLRSLRWRRRFAHEVRKKVQLVNEIRARGA
ncbi:hypothetical protein ONZ51_g4357 [Trametes cubensis]|uniref:Ribosomal protein S21 n=1 Tax=Trametes cubensis TaxID=1111947 RepID=A0AAD7XD18_9APHY|nr:hypothetical protein ONZ51_g4357 [Trametes cubensis]